MTSSIELVAGRYRLLSQIGSGGMGRVWLARDEVLRREVAVKEVVFPEDLPFEERNELCQRTLREARAAGRLNHPNVVAVYDVVQAEGRPWIVMEHVRSRSLYQLVKENGPLPPKRVAEIGLFVLSALRQAHKSGVWHRDVKPGNVLLAEDGRVVLTDFGLATLDGDGSVTRSGVILGSAQYISPERAREGASGPASDMWSLGATLYAAVEGKSPFARETSMATLTALATMPPDPMRRAGPLRAVLIGLLRKNPRQRLRPAEAEKMLRRIVDGDHRGLGRRLGRIPGQRRADRLTDPDSDSPDVVAPVAASPVGRVSLKGSPVLASREPPQASPEDTYRAPAGPRRWLLYGVVGAVVALGGAAVPTIVFLNQDSGAGTTQPTPSTPAPAVVEAMGAQACLALARTPERETAIAPPGRDFRAPYGLTPGWIYYVDRSGYFIGVPESWRTAQVGALRCFRDPTGPRAIAVLDRGTAPGAPIDLARAERRAWLEAAAIRDYQEIGVQDTNYLEGSADREYTYSGDLVRMHGVDRIARVGGRLFTVSYLTTDFAWSTDRTYNGIAQASFNLIR